MSGNGNNRNNVIKKRTAEAYNKISMAIESRLDERVIVAALENGKYYSLEKDDAEKLFDLACENGFTDVTDYLHFQRHGYITRDDYILKYINSETPIVYSTNAAAAAAAGAAKDAAYEEFFDAEAANKSAKLDARDALAAKAAAKAEATANAANAEAAAKAVYGPYTANAANSATLAAAARLELATAKKEEADAQYKLYADAHADAATETARAAAKLHAEAKKALDNANNAIFNLRNMTKSAYLHQVRDRAITAEYHASTKARKAAEDAHDKITSFWSRYYRAVIEIKETHKDAAKIAEEIASLRKPIVDIRRTCAKQTGGRKTRNNRRRKSKARKSRRS